MLKKVYGSAVFGVEAHTITVEVNVDNGIGYHLVGLQDNAIKESNFRIAAALENNGFRIPGKKIIINMSPADMRKEGSAYDLTLAVGILAASNQIKAQELERYVIMGELSLDGSLQPIKGALPIAIKAKQEGFKGFIPPDENAKEAAIVEGLMVYGVEHIMDVINFFDKNKMQTKHIRKFCVLDEVSKSLLKQAMEPLNLSARAYDRILKVARTIADLESSISIESRHISEAIQYRSLDRGGWLV